MESFGFPSPHPGIINFFDKKRIECPAVSGFRPLIRGLSISSKTKVEDTKAEVKFPSPHPGIINFF